MYDLLELSLIAAAVPGADPAILDIVRQLTTAPYCRDTGEDGPEAAPYAHC